MSQRLQNLTRMFFAGLIGAGTAAHAQGTTSDTLKFINNPGGGQVVYGTIDAKYTAQTGMAFMLKTVHGHFGDKPQVSNVFQVRNSDSYAAFFTLIAKNEGGRPIAGEVIVTLSKGAQPAAAVLYDDAPRFTKSQPALLKALSATWHAASAAAPSAPAPGAAPGGAQALRMQTGGDRSASIGLPEGWKITMVAGGGLSAEGPNGERVGLGLLYQGIHDPRSNAGPFMRGGIACPGNDLFKVYVCAINQQRQNQNMPPASFTLTSSRQLPGNAIEVIFDLDLHDGKGLRSASARLGALYTRGLPTWALTISNSSMPKTVAAAEGPTMKAILASYRQDSGVINGELQQQLNQIHAIGERSKIQAQAADARREASASAFDAHMDNIDRQSKAMQNYTLDRSQIQDNDQNGRATVSNGLANALVQTDPNRYQVVPPSQFLKGIDY